MTKVKHVITKVGLYGGKWIDAYTDNRWIVRHSVDRGWYMFRIGTFDDYREVPVDLMELVERAVAFYALTGSLKGFEQ